MTQERQPIWSSNSFTHSKRKLHIINNRVVSRFLSSRFHPNSRRLFPFYFSNITPRTDPLTFGVTGAVFKIAGEMRWLPAYFDDPWTSEKQKKVRGATGGKKSSKCFLLSRSRFWILKNPWTSFCAPIMHNLKARKNLMPRKIAQPPPLQS